MSGFFSKSELSSVSRPQGKAVTCVSCGLYRNCRSPRLVPSGKFQKRILLVGESPGDVEDERGEPWTGKAGRRLQRTLKSMGVDIKEDCLSTYAINCFSPEKDNQATACVSCRTRVIKLITERKPHLILVFGNLGVSSLIGHRWKKDLGAIFKWRGWTIPDRDFKAWLCPTFSPEFVEDRNAPEVDTLWEQDLRRAIDLLDQPIPPFHNDENDVEIIELKDYGMSSLYSVPDLAAFDYETTGLKPHAPGHQVVCASICANHRHSQVFLMPGTKGARRPFTHFLADPNIRKMAHNMKFEQAWSMVRLRQPVIGWEWDSMLAAHILDNRSYTTSLKFQAYVHFGVVDYDEDVNPYLRAEEEKNANAHNQILELLKRPDLTRKLLIYCGLDSLYEFRLAMLQRSIMGI